MVQLDLKSSSIQVMAPLFQSMNYHQQLSLISWVVPLGTVEFLTLKCNWASPLHEYGPNGLITSICIQDKRLRRIDYSQDRCSCNSHLKLFKSFLLRFPPTYISSFWPQLVSQQNCNLLRVVLHIRLVEPRQTKKNLQFFEINWCWPSENRFHFLWFHLRTFNGYNMS